MSQPQAPSARSSSRRAPQPTVLAHGTQDQDKSNKENVSVPRGGRHAQAPVIVQKAKKTAVDDIDSDAGNDSDYKDTGLGDASESDGHVSTFDEDNQNPVRSRDRDRRPSQKQQQLLDEFQAAEARKITKAKKAVKLAKKQAAHAAGDSEDEVLEPRRDDTFTSRTVPSRPMAVKALFQRDQRVPPAPKASTAFVVARDTVRHNDSVSHVRDSHIRRDDFGKEWRHRPSPSPVRFRGRSASPQARSPSPLRLYDINGVQAPNHIKLNLPYSGHPSSLHRKELVPSPASGKNHASAHATAQHFDRHQPGYSSPIPDRCPSPTSGDKHGRSESPSSDDLRMVQAQKMSHAQGRPKASDYDDITREVISLAITYYRCFLSIRDAYPDQATELSYLREAWEDACVSRGLSMELTPTISKLITNRGSHLRGELKTKIKPMVELMFSFKSGQNKKTIKANRQLCEDLKDNLTFTFKDTSARKGIYRNPLFQKAVNAMWFANRREEGPTYPHLFNPLPLPALALILTTTEHLIDEWGTGIRTDIPFSANEYREVYQTHLKALRRFEKETQQYGILGNILTRLHNIGRFHSGAQPITAYAPQPAISDEIIEAAIEEYKADSETESDGEDGDRND